MSALAPGNQPPPEPDPMSGKGRLASFRRYCHRQWPSSESLFSIWDNIHLIELAIHNLALTESAAGHRLTTPAATRQAESVSTRHDWDLQAGRIGIDSTARARSAVLCLGMGY